MAVQPSQHPGGRSVRFLPARRTHRIKRNEGQRFPQHLLFLDTESRSKSVNETTEEHRLWFGWCCYERQVRGRWTAPKWFRFSTPQEAWRIIESLVKPRWCLWVFAHNLNFDAAMIMLETHIRQHGWEVLTWAHKGPLMFIYARKGDRSLIFCDTLNFAKVPLSEIAKAVGLEKLPMPAPTASQTEWDNYCRRDVEILRAFIHLLIESIRSLNRTSVGLKLGDRG